MKEEKIWNKGFTTVTLSHSLVSLGAYMVIPTIPLFLVSLGATESVVGIVATAYYISSILTRFLINLVIARVGKKRALIAGLFLCSIVMASYGFAESVAAVAALRIIQGMGLGSASTIAVTLAVDFLPDSRRGQGLGYHTMGIVVAMTIGPAFALFLRSNFGFMPMFLIASCSSLIAAITVFFIDEPQIITSEPQGKQEEKAKAVDWRNIYDRKLIAPSVVVLLFGVCRSVDMNYIAIFAEERNLEFLSLYFVVQTATMFLIRLIIGPFVDKKGRNWILLPGGAAMLAFLITLSLTKTSAAMLLGAFFSGLGIGVLSPNLQVWMISLVNPKKRSVASASYYSFVELGSAIGAPLLGLAAENFGYTVMFRTGACVALLYIIVYIAIGREKKPRNT